MMGCKETMGGKGMMGGGGKDDDDDLLEEQQPRYIVCPD